MDLRRLIQPWQVRAFGYYDMLGEINYASQFYARGLSSLTLYAAEKDVEKDGDLKQTENVDVIATLDRIQDPGGGRSVMLAAYGRLMFLTGEAYLFVSDDPDNPGVEKWEVLSTDELRPIGGGNYQRVRAPSLLAEDYSSPDDDDWAPLEGRDGIAYRMWQRHPRYSGWADSTMRGVLDLCEELLLLTRSVRARARSRLAGSGILLLPDELSVKPLEPVGDEDPAEDPFMDDLTETMMAPIGDEGNSSAVVPMVVRGPAEFLGAIRLLHVVDPVQLYPETGLRRECIERIAIGLDMPPEVLEGLGGLNHWSAWQVDEQTWKAHLQPKAQQFVDDLTASYFRPTLRSLGIPNAEDFYIAYDATAIINHPDRTKDAKELHSVFAISDEALRTAAGFSDDDAIVEEGELARRVGIAVRDGSLALTGVPRAIDAPTGTTGKGVVTEDVTPGSDGPEDVVPGTPASSDVSAEPVPGSVVGSALNGRNGHPDVLASRVMGAAQMGLLRAREAAGNRVVALARRDVEMAPLIRDVPTGQVCFTLGRDRVRSLGEQTDLMLVAGSRDLIAEALRTFGVKDESLRSRIASSVEAHAARTLFDERPPPLPDALVKFVSSLSSEADAAVLV